ncbi:integrin alpha [Dyadobacter sp. CY261]|uniref:integrin alpha n=1 Tax=Dyadobacter sp. CY261 TaxID=2907203 RepID=UPI001F48259D|nr:integrin alpha [Dyadobacter sp. CY261]MCF0073620.1 integrin alpha [Dyadobacter sp. CY261]
MRHTYQKLLLPVLAAALILGCYAYRDHLTSTSAKTSSHKASLSRQEGDVIPQNALSQIQQNLSEREYYITYDSLKNTLQSPNRSHGLRAYYQPGQLTIVNRKDSAGHNFKLQLVNEGVYADGKKLFEPLKTAQTEPDGNKLHIRHKGFIEQYINDPSGIRQNFIVKNAPEGTSSLQVKLAIDGMQVADLGNNEILLTRRSATSNSEQLHYRDLHCWDANQKPLVASLAYVGGKIQIDVNVENAAYPVTIDPLVVNGNPANAATLLEKDQGLAAFGYSVSSAGDVNGDGFSDVIVGAPNYDKGETNEGVAFVYHGTATGLGTSPACTLESNQPEAKFGNSVSNAGDVNGDGFGDVIVGAPMYDKNENNEGAAFIYHGSDLVGINTQPFTTLESNQPDANLGHRVALAGDVDNNGFSDVIVGAPMYDNNESNEGAAFVYHGSGTGVATQAATTLEKNQPDAQFGCSVKGAGDVNGDGVSDVIVGASQYDKGQSNEGAAFVYHGYTNVGISAVVVTTLESDQATAYFGHSVSTAGDVNGDGFSDVIVGAYQYDNGQSNEGGAFVYHGSVNGIGSGVSKLLECNQAGAQYGVSVSAAGDVDGNGYADVIVGANFYDNGQSNEGAAFVY